jgi:hypothetical protein
MQLEQLRRREIIALLARTIGLTLSPDVVSIADEVIE